MKSDSASRFVSVVPLAMGVLFIASSPARAGTPMIESSPAGPVVTATHDDWQFTLALYGWMAGLNGDVGVGGMVSSVDMSFGDILDTLDAGIMGMFEARKGRWFGQIEGLYLKMSDNMPSPGPGGGALFTGINAVIKASRIEAVFGYRAVEGRTRLDLFGGVEWWGMDIEMNLFGGKVGLLPQGDRNDWFDPMIGFRLEHDFSECWTGILRGEVGGFGLNADISWQAVGLIAYEIKPNTHLVAGWRHTAVDYSDGGFVFDAAMNGPMIGATFAW